MHYQDGTPARIGDLAKKVTVSGAGANAQTETHIGQVIRATPGATSCNGTLRTFAVVRESQLGRAVEILQNPYNELCVTFGECEKVA